ncbi:hypothetical protein [Streptomyces sp. NPDC056672]|uniref:hypothetical protein n=1 Tax=Streptomyces sp. NPDC056672 TaxID=3345906 RepID=UPI0036785BE6
MVYKPVRDTPYRVDGQPRSVWVREVRGAEITDAVSVCPHLFHAKVDKAFDFAVTAAGDWYFLECNPNGQWAWQPAETVAAIAHALTDQLEKGPGT